MTKILFALFALLIVIAYTFFSLLHAQPPLFQLGWQLMSSWQTAQVIIELYILVFLACIWMYQHHKAQGKSFYLLLPYFMLTVFFSSIGPLAYLVIEGLSDYYKDYTC